MASLGGVMNPYSNELKYCSTKSTNNFAVFETGPGLHYCAGNETRKEGVFKFFWVRQSHNNAAAALAPALLGTAGAVGDVRPRFPAALKQSHAMPIFAP